METSVLVLPPAYWVHDWSPFLVQFTEHLGLRWYGLSYVAGFLLGALGLQWYAHRGRVPLDAAARERLLMALVIGVILGGRLGFLLLYDWANFRHDPLLFFRFWEGGMASHGGFVGVALALAWFARRQRIRVLTLGDWICTLAPAGLFLGRVANFINGELWGKPATVAWAVVFPKAPYTADAPAVLVPGLGLANPRHPSQLYEAGLEGALLLAWMQARFWLSPSARIYPGRLSGEFLALYGIARVLGEQFREPDAPLLAGLSRGAFYSLFAILAGLVLMVWSRQLFSTPPLTDRRSG